MISPIASALARRRPTPLQIPRLCFPSRSLPRRAPSHRWVSTRPTSATSPTKPPSAINDARPTMLKSEPPMMQVNDLKNEPQKSIPVPTSLWLEPFRAYGRVHQRRPYMTQFISALVIYLVGDFVAQSIGGLNDIDDAVTPEAGPEKAPIIDNIQSWATERDWSRTGRALLIGGLAAVPGYKWFLWLSNAFNFPSKILSLCVKVTVNQALFTPLFNTYFFSMQHLLSNSWDDISLQSLGTHIRNTVPTSWYNSCKIWPAVTAFSFTFVNLEYRSLVAGVVAIGWQTYLSLVDARAKRAEREREKSMGV
ncbi:hypothetical protein M011DRAFT_299232 [Sporormia fimetaria CBS 119925]|uniref:Uncharacterized protein n=1 Tax=Sporormia fimetaria CBS 119925 TaxID=1340428 RepID=A0A6A6UUG7_9PLEO|nr:hypothetical protein M011DRAFT_299232 [Sporormia fimetaria CBS 119925]